METSQAEANARRARELSAFREWSGALIPSPLLQELEAAAEESHVSLARLVAEILESHAAARRLPKVETPADHRGPYRRVGEPADHDNFPFPAETYRVLV